MSPSKDQTVSQVAFRIINDSFVVFKVFLRVGSKLCEHLIFSAIVILGVDESSIRQELAVGRFLACALAAISGANFTTQRFSVAWSTVTPRSPRISSRSR